MWFWGYLLLCRSESLCWQGWRKAIKNKKMPGEPSPKFTTKSGDLAIPTASDGKPRIYLMYLVLVPTSNAIFTFVEFPPGNQTTVYCSKYITYVFHIFEHVKMLYLHPLWNSHQYYTSTQRPQLWVLGSAMNAPAANRKEDPQLQPPSVPVPTKYGLIVIPIFCGTLPESSPYSPFMLPWSDRIDLWSPEPQEQVQWMSSSTAHPSMPCSATSVSIQRSLSGYSSMRRCKYLTELACGVFIHDIQSRGFVFGRPYAFEKWMANSEYKNQ